VREATRFNDQFRVQSGSLGRASTMDASGVELGGGLGGRWAFAKYGERNVDLAGGRPDVTFRVWSVSTGWILTGKVTPIPAASASSPSSTSPSP
jgi:hypothetical protein